MFDYWMPGWWNCLARFRKCGLAGGSISLRAGFQVSKPWAIPSALCFTLVVPDVRLRLPAPAAILATCHPLGP